MFDIIKSKALAMAIVASAMMIGSEQALALDGPEDGYVFYSQGQALGPSCKVNMTYDTVSPLTWGRLQVELHVFGEGSHFAGGYYRFYFTGALSDLAQVEPISESVLTNKCGLTNVSDFQVDGLSSNHVTDDYYGFSFKATDPTNGILSQYEFAYSGITSTQTILSVTPLNQAPVANAGADQTVASATAPVMLDGTASSDPESQTLTYAWTAPAGITLSDATAASPTFTAPTVAAGDADLTLTFSLIVTDSLGFASVADTVTVTVASGLSVTLSGGPDAITGTDPFSLTATFSKNVTGFDNLASDVIVTNGTVTAISGGPAIYTLTITPIGNGDVSITIPVAAAQDSVGSANSVSNTLVIGSRIAEITQEQIAGFMRGRANNLASNQPGLTRFLMGEGCGAFSASASGESGSVSGCVMRANTWAEINSSWSGNGSYTLGTIGAHSILNPNLLVGGMIQFDYADDPANNASGQGFMVGPYFVAKTPDKPLYLEGRLLYGQSDNDITPLGTYTDSFETDRWLAQLRATGEYKFQNTTLMPLLDVTYTEDNQRAYIDSLGNTIPGQTVDLMQVRAGLDFSTPIPVSLGSLKLTGGISGIYSSSKGAAAAPVFENWRGRTHLGLDYDTGAGTTVRFGSFYDGLGTDYESYGADLSIEMRF